MQWGEIIRTDSGSVEPHLYGTYKPTEMPLWLNAVASEYVQLRSECTIDLPDSIDVAGIGIFDVSLIKSKLAEKLVPPSTATNNPLSVTRSDLSETAAYMLLEREFGTRIAYKLVRDRELIQLPGRGIDAIGIEDGQKLLIILCEIKFSDEASAPKAPQVVDTSKDGMRSQHRGHLSEISVTVAKIWDCARRAKNGEIQQSLMAAALYLENGMLDHVGIVSCCVLVRPEERHCVEDFGSFKNNPTDYQPASVRFLVWLLPGNLNEILNGWEIAVKSAQGGA